MCLRLYSFKERFMRPFVIWFQHRSGSSHLVSLLNSHHDIYCKGEIFGCFRVGPSSEAKRNPNYKTLGENAFRRVINQFPGRIEDPDDKQCANELDNFLFPTASPGETRVRGFKFKFPSQATVFSEISEALTARSHELNLIVLHRKDYLKRAISVINLERVQAIADKANVSEPIALPASTFDAQEVVRLMKYYREIQADFENWANAFPNCFELDYQDLNSDQKLTELQNFIGVGTKSLSSSTQKITPDDLSAHVSNLDEIMGAIKDAGLDQES